MTDPYRTPGKVVSASERKAAWQRELDGLRLMNANGRTADELRVIVARIRELEGFLRSIA